jgi:hypothetical protein
LEGRGLAHHHVRHPHHRHDRPEHEPERPINIVRNIVEKVEKLEDLKKKEEILSKQPKHLMKKEIKKRKEDNHPEENIERNNFHDSSKNSYLQEPGPGARARCLETSSFEKTFRKTSPGVQKSSSSSSTITDGLKCLHENSKEIREQASLCLFSENCSCSTDTAHGRGTVLAGRLSLLNSNINVKTGGKTTSGGTDNQNIVESEQYPENSAILILNEHPRGLHSMNITQIKTQDQAQKATEPEEVQ